MKLDVNNMPKLGFGLMRLPETDGVIDLEKGVCHQHLSIIEHMKEAVEKFEN